MAEKVEDLNLPNSVIQRIIKETIPPGVNVKKEARTAIARAASVFVLYLTSSANNLSIKNNRKTISGGDVVNALSLTDFDRFVDPLNIALAEYKQSQHLKKLNLLAGKKTADLDASKTSETADKTIEEEDSEATEDAAEDDESEEEDSTIANPT